MSCYERCPHCIVPAMAPRVHPLGTGQVFLECPDCGYTEDVRRKPDPAPSRAATYTCGDGSTRVRYLAPRRAFKVPRKSLSNADGLAMLRAVARKLGRTPTVKELASPDCPCPTQSWFRTRFGSLNAAVEAAGLTPNAVGNPVGRGPGITCGWKEAS